VQHSLQSTSNLCSAGTSHKGGMTGQLIRFTQYIAHMQTGIRFPRHLGLNLRHCSEG